MSIMQDMYASVKEINKTKSAYSLAELMTKLNIAKLVIVSNQLNYQFVYWGDRPLSHKKPMIPLSTLSGINDAYGVLVPIECQDYHDVNNYGITTLAYDI